MSALRETFLSIEIGGTKLQIVAGDAAANLVERRRFTVDPAQGGAGIRRQLEEALPALVTQWQPAAIGVGFGGPVDWKTGCICRSHQVAGWSDFPLGEWLHQLTNLPVSVENDSNAATLGEALRGAGVGLDPVFYFNMGSGVGGGLAVDRRIYHGARPGEAEFGHLRLDRAGAIVEDRCSGWAVDARIRALRQSEPASLLGRLIGDQTGGESRHLAAALSGGDAAARRILNEISGDLAFALSHAVHLFHPEVVVMGGGLSLVGEPLRAAVAAELDRFVMEAFKPCPPVRLAALGEDAVPVGALLLAQAIRAGQ